MSLVEKLCKEIGVEIGEEWKATDWNTYWIDPEGTLYMVEYSGIFNQHRHFTEKNISKILSGEIRPVEPAWEPKFGKKYYVPSISMEDKYISLTWTDTEGDRRNQERGAVFKTKEEAINMTEKILGFIKEEINNE